MSKPRELPNIPRDDKTVKRAIVPKRGAFSFMDYGQVEPRLFGYFVARLGDPTIADWYREGRDVYVEIAARAFSKPASEITPEERQRGKVFFLMSLYGAGPRKVGAELGIPYAEARDFYLAFHDGLPQIRLLSNPRPQNPKYLDRWQPGAIERVIAKRGYLKTLHGRHLHVPQFGEHKMMNTLIQGSAADLMKASLLRVDKWIRGSRTWDEAREGVGQWVTPGDYEALSRHAAEIEVHGGLKSRLVSVIHDEIILDGPESEIDLLHEAIPPLMREERITEVIPLDIDHEVSLTNWAEKVEYDQWKESLVR